MTIVCVRNDCQLQKSRFMRDMEFSRAFGLVLQKHRRERGLSQELIAEKADIHPTHVGLIERNKRNPSLNVAKSLANALNSSLSEMISEAETLQKTSAGKRGKK